MELLRILLSGRSPTDYVKRFPFIQELTEKSFSVFSATKLLNFSFNQMYLQRVAHYLTNDLVKISRNVDVEIIVICPPPVMPCIKITISSNGNLVYKALMFTIDNVQRSEKYITLPFYCEVINTKPKIASKVKTFMKERFGCLIKPSSLPITVFRRTVGIVFHYSLKRETLGDVTLTFSLKDKAEIKLSIDEEIATALWNTCLQGKVNHEDMSESLADEWIEGINKYFLNNYGLHLKKLIPTEAKLSGATINMKDCLKITSTDWGSTFIIISYLNLALSWPGC